MLELRQHLRQGEVLLGQMVLELFTPGIGPMLAVIWKFFAASVGAGIGTALIVRAVPYFGTLIGTGGAFLRMMEVSLLFVGLYIVGVIVLHRGLKPIRDTVNLLRDFLPERAFRRVEEIEVPA